MTIKKEAKSIYFDQVKVEKYRENFLKNLETLPITDNRHKGYYCSYCRKYTEKPQMGFHSETVIHVWEKGNVKELMIVKPHYDGCRGWD